MSGQPILARWDETREARKNEPAIIAPDGRVLSTFAGIEEEARRWESRIAARVVALQLGNAPAWPAILLACWRAGCAVVPFETEMPVERRGRIEELCGVGQRFVRRNGRVEIETREASAVNGGGADFLKLTSGTTTEPRAVRFTAAQLLADCDNVCDSMGLRENDRNYGVISFAHSYGFSNLVTPLLCRGVALVAAADAIPRALIEGFSASGATVFPGVPALFRVLSALDPGPNDLRLCISAGAPLDVEVARRFAGRWGRKVHSFYGASECGGICYDASDTPGTPPGYVGTPMKNVRVGHPGGVARAEIRGEAVGLGYFPEPDAALADGVFSPADLLEPCGEGFVIAGRVSDFINVAGRKANPLEIERVISAHPGVREAVALGLPAETRGEDIAVLVAGSASEEELRAACARGLPAWLMPRRWFFVPEIPRNARGKISRADLRAMIPRS